MKVLSVNPHGYCAGVENAMKIAYSAKKKYPDKAIYLLGNLVHNEIATANLSKLGFFTLDEKKAPLETQLNNLKKGDVVVFSAHGHPERYEKIAKQKGLITLDATCRYVNENLKAGLNAKAPLFYLGAKGHLEAEAFKANCPQAHFLDAKAPFCLEQGQNCSLVAQTTLSKEEVEKGEKELAAHFKKVELLRSRCDATRLRQQAIANLPPEVDVLIVLGSATSNNSKKLAEIGESIGKETYLVLDKSEIEKLNLSCKKYAALSSGASTPKEVYEEAKTYLESL